MMRYFGRGCYLLFQGRLRAGITAAHGFLSREDGAGWLPLPHRVPPRCCDGELETGRYHRRPAAGCTAAAVTMAVIEHFREHGRPNINMAVYMYVVFLAHTMPQAGLQLQRCAKARPRASILNSKDYL